MDKSCKNDGLRISPNNLLILLLVMSTNDTKTRASIASPCIKTQENLLHTSIEDVHNNSRHLATIHSYPSVQALTCKTAAHVAILHQGWHWSTGKLSQK